MKTHFFYLFCLLSFAVQSQQDARWVLGDSTYPAGSGFPNGCCAFEMTFPGDTFDIHPVVRNFPATAYLSNDGVTSTSASICDGAGNLALQIDSYVIRNHQGDTLENGKLQMAANMWNAASTIPVGVFRSIHLLPVREQVNHYKVIYPYQEWRTYGLYPAPEKLNTGLLYADIDMNANNGKGKVVSHQYFSQDTIMQFAVGVVQHANGRDWWVVAPDYKQNKYYQFLIDTQDVQSYPPQTVGTPPIYDVMFSCGGAYFSQDGSKFIVDSPDNYKIMDFDRCTGLLSNYREIRGINYGCPKGENNLYIVFSTLSPNNRFLYVSDIGHQGPLCTGVDSMKYNRLYQYDLWEADPALDPVVLMESDATLTSNGTGAISAPFLTPNGMLVLNYHNTGPSTTFNMVRKPDLKGMACKPLRIPYQSYVPFTFSTLPNYSLGAVIGSACDTVIIHSAIVEGAKTENISIYPNPTDGVLNIRFSEAYINQAYRLYNMMGQKVLEGILSEKQSQSIDMSGYISGIYLLQIGGNTFKVILQ